MYTKTFDPARVVIQWGNLILTGFADGVFAKLTWSSDLYSKVVGATGDVTRVRIRNGTAEFEVTLQGHAPANRQMEELAALDAGSNSGMRALSVRDMSGTTSLVAPYAWVKRRPDVEFGTDASNRVWTLDLGNVDGLIGGGL